MDIEICLCSDNKSLLAANVAAAYQAGAARIELCAAMAQDGLTPDPEAISIARQAFGRRRGLLVMIRPRGGDFAYNEAEIMLMHDQIAQAAELGADGVVFGVLTQGQYSLNLPVMAQLIKRCQQYKLEVSCHRAFDAVNDKEAALSQLIELGVHRVLTNGSAWGSKASAWQSIEVLRDTVKRADGNIEVVIAGGVNSANAPEIVQALAPCQQELSLHAYSGVLNKQVIDVAALTELVNL